VKRLVSSAFLAMTFLAASAPQAKAAGFGFGFNACVNFSCNFNCWANCGGCPPCGSCQPCYGYGGCFVPGYCAMGYPSPIGADHGGYPGYPGPGPNFAAGAYGFPQGPWGTAQPVGYYPPSGGPGCGYPGCYSGR
jgi:hypothetical protein